MRRESVSPDQNGLCSRGAFQRRLPLIVKLVISIACGCGVVFYWEYGGGEVPFVNSSFDCETEWTAPLVKNMQQKGLVIDDRTMGNCAKQIPEHWPNTEQTKSNIVASLRLFRSTQDGWNVGDITQFALTFSQHAKRNNVKVLVGTQITCDSEADDRDWSYTLTLLTSLGANHVLGLAVGNELDLLWKHPEAKGTFNTIEECIENLWGNSIKDGYLFKTFRKRVDDMRNLGSDYANIKVTSVFTAGVIWTPPLNPFQDDKNCKSGSFVRAIWDTDDLKTSWVFALNFYPYFDTTLQMDQPGGKTCKNAIDACKCFNAAQCKMPINLRQARMQIQQMTSSTTSPLWIGEFGWSSPKASTLGGAMQYCENFSSLEMYGDVYENFLAWDLSIPGGGYGPVEQAFFFSIRDSNNFGNEEHFGLMEKCEQFGTKCKIQSRHSSNYVKSELNSVVL